MYNSQISVKSQYMDSDNQIATEDWIRLGADSSFECVECENTNKPQSYDEHGELSDIDIDEAKVKMDQSPNVKISAVCSVCGMEYELVEDEGGVALIPSDEEK